jgi:Ser-tRNA(Ala) deacylase AlaX
MNIAIVIIHILFNVKRKKYDVAIDRIEAIEKYGYRYLSESETSKSFHFIKLLQTLPRANFNHKLVRIYAEENLRILNEEEAESGSFHKIEIIPYENIWEMMLSLLAK